MKRYLVLAMLIALTISQLASCSKDEKKTETKSPAKKIFYVVQNGETEDFDIDLGKGLHITSAVTILGTEGHYLTEKEYKELVGNPMEGIGGDTALEEGFAVDTYKIYYDLERMKRITPLSDGATMIYAPESLKYYSEIFDKGNFKVSGEMLVIMDKVLAVEYDLINHAKTMVSGESLDEGFAISPKYKYAATGFIPKLAKVKGFFTGAGDEHNKVTALYPHVMKNGYMDGIYVVIQSDYKDAFLELE